jgi:VIT1/CCC1 family predicted Fe2+/Mn2+ transporter
METGHQSSSPDQRGQRVVGSLTKAFTAIVAFIGAVLGLVSFFKLDKSIVIWSVYLGTILVLGYFGMRAKYRLLRIASWIIFGLLVAFPVVLNYIARH